MIEVIKGAWSSCRKFYTTTFYSATVRYVFFVRNPTTYKPIHHHPIGPFRFVLFVEAPSFLPSFLDSIMFVSARGGEVCLSLFWWNPEYGQESTQFQRQRDARSLGHGHVLWRQKRRPIKAQKEISMCLKSPQSQKAKARVVGRVRVE